MKLRYARGALADLEVAGLIAEQPHIGVATGKSNFRRFPVGKYLIVYEIRSDEIIIQYVRHGARRQPWESP